MDISDHTRQSKLGEGDDYGTCRPVNHKDWLGGPGWQATAPSTFTSPCPGLFYFHAEPNKSVYPKGKEVSVSGFLQTWPWPAPRRAERQHQGHESVRGQLVNSNVGDGLP